MTEAIKKTGEVIGEQLTNFNSKKFGVVVAAGYVIRDMALSDNQIPWYYPITVAIIAITYTAFQSLLDGRNK